MSQIPATPQEFVGKIQFIIDLRYIFFGQQRKLGQKIVLVKKVRFCSTLSSSDLVLVRPCIVLME